jgi:hypothetical protein
MPPEDEDRPPAIVRSMHSYTGGTDGSVGYGLNRTVMPGWRRHVYYMEAYIAGKPRKEAMKIAKSANRSTYKFNESNRNT